MTIQKLTAIVGSLVGLVSAEPFIPSSTGQPSRAKPGRVAFRNNR